MHHSAGFCKKQFEIGPFSPKNRRNHLPIAKAVNAGQDQGMEDKQNNTESQAFRAHDKVQFDLDDYVARTQAGPCFICELVNGNPKFKHHIVWENPEFVVFLNKYPTLPGYLIVSPKSHVEDYAEQMGVAEYLKMQRLIHKISTALKLLCDAERIYQLSLGSAQGNSHVHFHIAPLPKGVPYEEQQYNALMAENGVISYTEEEFATMAKQISASIGAFELDE